MVVAASWNDLVSGVDLEIFETGNVVPFWVGAILVMNRVCAEQRHAECRLAIRGLGSAQIQSLVSLNHLKSVPVASQRMLETARWKRARDQSALLPP